jgi:hypothetical protein
LHSRLVELGRRIEEVDEFAANVQRALPRYAEIPAERDVPIRGSIAKLLKNS